MHFPNTIEWFEEESKNFKEKNCVFYVKIINFSSNWPNRTFCELTEGSADPVRPKMAEGSAEPVRFGRTLNLVLQTFISQSSFIFKRILATLPCLELEMLVFKVSILS